MSADTLPPRPIRRRDVLRYAGLAGLVPALSFGGAIPGVPRSTAAAATVATTYDVRPFPLARVALRSGVFTRKRELVLDHARAYDVDRLLTVFRANAGLSTLGAVAPGGWEGIDGEANGNLRGHYCGHFLSMLAQAGASTGEQIFDDKLSAMVSAMYESRESLRRENPWVLSVDGKHGRAIENVRGSYQYVDLPAAAFGTPSAFTLSMWVRPTRASKWTRLFETGSSTVTYMHLAQCNDRGVPRFAITRSGAGGEMVVEGTAPLPVDTWSHVAVTLGGTTATLYVNGTAVGANTSVTLNPSVLGAVANHWIGRSHFANDPLYTGALDEVNLYGRALTAVEIAALQSGSAADTVGRGDLASYNFDDVDTSTIADASGRGHDATLKRTWGAPSHRGFLAAYPETQFIDLETRTAADYTIVWAPYYTAHKILKGLVDAHHNSGDADTRAKALDLASGMCDWMHFRLSALSDTVRQRMWGIFSSGEFGGIVEAIVDTYELTGKAEHLELAGLFDLDSLIDACAANTDTLNSLHANQHIPIFNGLIRLYESTGEQRYLTSARNFWPMVAEHRMFSIGGTSVAEFWKTRDAIASTLTSTNAETCCAHNMIKLSRLLFFHEQDPRYIDYLERTLYNQILGSKQDATDAEVPLMTYFIGLAPGSVRDFRPKAGTTCCEGTGLESATKYQDSIYFRTADDDALYVNLFSPSVLDWSQKGVTVTQTTDFPFEEGTTLRIGGSASFALRLRRPAWAEVGYKVAVNGTAVDTASTAPGSYLTISRTWSDGDTVTVRMPFTTRTEATPDDPALRAVFRGPVQLVARSSSTSDLKVSLDRRRRLSGDLSDAFVPVPGKSLHLKLGNVEFAPFLEGTTDAFHTYVRHATATVVLGGVDSGVANVRGSDNATLLDTIWSTAPFASKAEFVDRVRQVSASWLDEGRITRAGHQRILMTAGKARIQP